MSDDIKSLETILAKLEGMPLWGFGIGPCGIFFHAGAAHPRPPLVEGDIVFFVGGSILVNGKDRGVLWESGPLLSPENKESIALFIDGAHITEAAFDPKSNSLRLVLNDERLFSAFPHPGCLGTSNRETFVWAIYDYSVQPCHYVVVTPTEIKASVEPDKKCDG